MAELEFEDREPKSRLFFTDHEVTVWGAYSPRAYEWILDVEKPEFHQDLVQSW